MMYKKGLQGMLLLKPSPWNCSIRGLVCAGTLRNTTGLRVGVIFLP